MVKIDSTVSGSDGFQGASDGGNLGGSGHNFRVLNGIYSGSVWAICKSGPGNCGFSVTVRRNVAGAASYTHKFTATKSCAKYTWTDTQFETGASATGIILLVINTTAPNVYDFDDVDYEKTSGQIAANTSVFTDEFYQSIIDAHYGSIRWHDTSGTYGETFLDWIGSQWRRHAVHWAQAGGGYSLTNGLTEELNLCEVMAAQGSLKTCWIPVPIAWPAADYATMVEYVGGASGTAGGALRVANGHSTPWTSTIP
jgi:hypothetical protein